jgi:hypothetical protein
MSAIQPGGGTRLGLRHFNDLPEHQPNRKKLMSIPAFAWGYQRWLRIMDLVEAMEVWKTSRRLVQSIADFLRVHLRQFQSLRHPKSHDYGHREVRHRS